MFTLSICINEFVYQNKCVACGDFPCKHMVFSQCSPYAAVEPESDINQMTYIEDTGT